MAEIVVAYKFLVDLAKIHPDLGFTISQLLKAALWASLCLILCGLFLGPLGILVGGIAGSCVAYAKSKSFKPLWMILGSMSEAERQRLGKKVAELCKERGINLAKSSATALPLDVGREILKEVLKYANKA
jgi:hypothetical protein